MSAKQKELKAKHGTPQEFAKAVWAAEAQLFITAAEAEAAIAKYSREWDEAGH